MPKKCCKTGTASSFTYALSRNYFTTLRYKYKQPLVVRVRMCVCPTVAFFDFT